MTILRKLSIILWGFIVRLLKSLLEVLVWIDQGVGLLIAIPFYLILGHPVPNSSYTISSLVGMYASQDKPWALKAEWVLDRVFYIFEGFKLGHCRKHIECDDIDWENANHF